MFNCCMKSKVHLLVLVAVAKLLYHKKLCNPNETIIRTILSGARMMYLLDPSSQDKAISIATRLDANLAGCNPKVGFLRFFNVATRQTP